MSETITMTSRAGTTVHPLWNSDRITIQLVAILSTKEGFTHMTPEEVYDFAAKQAEEIISEAGRIRALVQE